MNIEIGVEKYNTKTIAVVNASLYFFFPVFKTLCRIRYKKDIFSFAKHGNNLYVAQHNV